jgi:hypothetical protein
VTDSSKWIDKLTNLKKLMHRLEKYLLDLGKSIKTKDIDLIEIAKHNSFENISRFF